MLHAAITPHHYRNPEFGQTPPSAVARAHPEDVARHQHWLTQSRPGINVEFPVVPEKVPLVTCGNLQLEELLTSLDITESAMLGDGWCMARTPDAIYVWFTLPNEINLLSVATQLAANVGSFSVADEVQANALRLFVKNHLVNTDVAISPASGWFSPKYTLPNAPNVPALHGDMAQLHNPSAWSITGYQGFVMVPAELYQGSMATLPIVWGEIKTEGSSVPVVTSLQEGMTAFGIQLAYTPLVIAEQLPSSTPSAANPVEVSTQQSTVPVTEWESVGEVATVPPLQDDRTYAVNDKGELVDLAPLKVVGQLVCSGAVVVALVLLVVGGPSAKKQRSGNGIRSNFPEHDPDNDGTKPVRLPNRGATSREDRTPVSSQPTVTLSRTKQPDVKEIKSETPYTDFYNRLSGREQIAFEKSEAEFTRSHPDVSGDTRWAKLIEKWQQTHSGGGGDDAEVYYE